MKSNQRIKILSAEEMRQETVDLSKDPTTGFCTITAQCSNGNEVSCTGEICEKVPGLVNGNWVVKGVECYDSTHTRLLESGICEYGTGASGAEQACIGIPVGEHCEWRDETALMHYGFCQYDTNTAPMKVVCVEGGSGSGSGY